MAQASPALGPTNHKMGKYLFYPGKNNKNRCHKAALGHGHKKVTRHKANAQKRQWVQRIHALAVAQDGVFGFGPGPKDWPQGSSDQKYNKLPDGKYW